ncbi:LAQU0S01e05380g1_1 [Lachancea quebecensis]|uniref:Anaphase-promoting complex subunit 5 n=1 Tax=Lachancea quebecensis TaxID=1654605 RepID=A0A0P1KP69_9SACH|nr:LAQU0S01e05380g1_1 [Lachancea quebecensis]
MTLGQSITITDTLTPHDISILILIGFFCSGVEHFDQRIMIKLLPPSSPHEELPVLFESQQRESTKTIVLPYLLDLVVFLIENDQKSAAFRLISTLKAVSTIDGISKLVDALKTHCLRGSYRDLLKPAERKVIKRELTRSSLLGTFVEQCSIKYKVQDFNESEMLWRNLKTYIIRFEESAVFKKVESQLPELDQFMSVVLGGGRGSETIESLEELQRMGLPERYNDLLSNAESMIVMISSDHLRTLLNEEVCLLLNGHAHIRKSTKRIVNCMSLEDCSRFPSVHILKGIEQLNDQRYDSFLTLLYRYFDYMLGQHNEPNFHMSLLSLASFYAHFDDNEAAVKTFEEAVAVARENKDTKTLNFILMWVFEFIVKFPSLAVKFHVSAEQIINYLKSCPSDQNSSVFEMAYKFETLWTMLNSGSVVGVLEALFKASLITLQNVTNKPKLSLLANHNAQVWEYLGSHALQKTYEDIAKAYLKQSSNFSIKAGNLLGSRNSGVVRYELYTSRSPLLTYHERKSLELLGVSHLGRIGESDEAIRLANAKLRECKSEFLDINHEQRFTLAKCQIMINCGMEMRCLPILTKVIEDVITAGNAQLAALCILLLSRILLSLRKLPELEELLNSTMHNVLKFAKPEINFAFFDVYYLSRCANKNAGKEQVRPLNSISTLKDLRNQFQSHNISLFD